MAKIDFATVNTDDIKDEEISLGTNLQDCSLIASTYERAAHYTPSESAIFATLTRNLKNNREFALASASSMSSYLKIPQQSASSSVDQGQQLGIYNSQNQGAVAGQTQHGTQELNIGTQQQSTTNDFGSKLLDKLRDCIPCNLRINAFLEIKPNIDFLASFESYINATLSNLLEVTSLLNNFDTYGDFCQLLDLLSFMCIPDLQKIIALLMALFMLEAPKFDDLMAFLQSFIVPLFAPILSGLFSLLDKFSLLVTNPLKCVLDAINAQLQKLSTGTKISLDEKTIDSLTGGLETLAQQIQEGIESVQNQIEFYTSQIKAMLGDMGTNDRAYIQAKFKVLNLVRMIAFVKAIIEALSQGHVACDPTQPTGKSEIDSFFNNYLNPNGAFNTWIDEQGNLNIDEKDNEYAKALKTDIPVLEYEGDPLLEKIQQGMSPVKVQLPCRLKTSSDKVDKVNRWIAELS